MLDYRDDIVSDLRVLHGVADWRTLDAATFFASVTRLPAYQGVLRARLIAEQAEQKRDPAATIQDDRAALAQLQADGWVERG